MATFKGVIRDYLSQTDNAYAVRIRLTHNRRIAYVRTNYRVPKDKVTQKGNIKSEIVKNGLLTDIKLLTNKVSNMGRKIDNYTARELADVLEKHLEMHAGVRKDYIDFIEYGEKLAETMIAKGQHSTGEKYIMTLRTVKKYIESDTLNINDVTFRWLQQFEAWLLTKPSASNKKNTKAADLKPISATSVAAYMRCLRAIFNKAREEFNDDDRGEIAIAHYPFQKYKIPAEEAPKKRALPVETVRAIRDFTPAGKRGDKRATLARDVFMLSFYLMGMNLIDLFECTEIERKRIVIDGNARIQRRLNYCRSKTRGKRDDNAEMSVLLVPEVDSLLEACADPTGQRVFNFYQLYASIANFTSAVNDGLKTVGGHESIKVPGLTFYAARHSFATIARNDCGVSIEGVASCLNHSIPGFEVTDKYLKRDWSKNDAVQRNVLDKINQVWETQTFDKRKS